MSGLADRLGLCSVTLRQLTADDVLAAAVRASLTCVEWGADVHAPPHEPERLERLREATRASGLRVASYGSYWRAGTDDLSSGRQVVEAAAVLGAPRVRVWAGSAGSDLATPADREAVIRATSALAGVAADLGVTVAFEFHADTLADSTDSVLDLLDRIDSPVVRTYWQPPNGVPDAVALQGLELVLDRVDAVHVFSWWPHTERRPLLDREGLWRGVVARLAGCQRPVDLLMEFVADDRPDILVSDAAALRSLVERSAA